MSAKLPPIHYDLDDPDPVNRAAAEASFGTWLSMKRRSARTLRVEANAKDKVARVHSANARQKLLLPLFQAIAISAQSRVTPRSLFMSAAEYLAGWEGDERCQEIADEIMQNDEFAEGPPSWQTVRDLFRGCSLGDMTGA